MRKVEIGEPGRTQVLCLGLPGIGGACHEYRVYPTEDRVPCEGHKPFASISFQNGAIQEAGVNGCTNENLIAIVIDRLNGFQSGQFKCPENGYANYHLEKALEWLNKRTKARIERGVEGRQIQ